MAGEQQIWQCELLAALDTVASPISINCFAYKKDLNAYQDRKISCC